MSGYDVQCVNSVAALNILCFFFFIIVSYSLAPEAHFPQPYYDALKAATFFLRPEVLAQYAVDPKRVAISGDSSGGNLAAAVVQQVGKKVGAFGSDS